MQGVYFHFLKGKYFFWQVAAGRYFLPAPGDIMTTAHKGCVCEALERPGGLFSSANVNFDPVPRTDFAPEGQGR